MKLTKMGEYAILGLIYMSNQEKDVILAKEVAEKLGLPQKFLAKIFQMLAKSDILNSYKGKGGGFSINRPSENITLGEIIETIQGPSLIMPCAAKESNCSRYQLCPLENIFKTAQKQLDDYFNSITLDKLASEIRI